jgi:mRNA-degrading endonuclease toxin of MazEF toxin-antitoxin module
VVNCDNIVTIPKTALGEQIGYLLPQTRLSRASADVRKLGLGQVADQLR